jgi:polyisoprenyl-phosphate glycosyltransferase
VGVGFPPSDQYPRVDLFTEGRTFQVMKTVVTVVYPVLNEADGAPMLADRMARLVDINPEYEFEFVVVDDGSTDSTTEILRRTIRPTIDLRIVTLARNFGSHAALSAGLDAARGNCAILLGADLQEPETLVSDFLAAWSAGSEVVWGVRNQRKVESLSSRAASVLFSRLFTKYADLENYPSEGPSGVLCDRAVIDVVQDLNERNRNLYGLIAWVGFKQTRVKFEQNERQVGQSKWTTRKLVKLALDSLVQFSSAPIRLMSYVGILFASVGFLYATILIGRAAFIQRGPAGWTSVIVAVMVIGGVQLLMLGLLGEYLWRGVDETRQRKLYVVDKRRSTPPTER